MWAMNKVDDLALAAYTDDYGVVELGFYDRGMFSCCASAQVEVLIYAHELKPLNEHTRTYISISLNGDDAWWIDAPSASSSRAALVEALQDQGLPIPVDIKDMTAYQLEKLARLLGVE
jgi:hypothetical protein